MPATVPPGRSIVTRRAVVDIVRAATLGSYGVTGFAGHGLSARLAHWLGLRPLGIDLRLAPRLEIDLWLTVAWGLPVAEVARQVDSAVRYSIRRALGCEVDALVIHVNRLRVLPTVAPSASSGASAPSATVSAARAPSDGTADEAAAAASSPDVATR